MAKYIKCDGCGNKIKFGETVYNYDGRCAVYCSAECFADSYGTELVLNEYVVDNCCCKVYDDTSIRELKESIKRAQLELTEMQAELDMLEKELGK